MSLTMDDLVFDSQPDPITEEGEPTKPRRGRPPGSKNGSARAKLPAAQNRTVNEAMGAMQSAYDLIGLFLKPLAPTAAAMFSAGVPKAQESNQRAFEASPKLAKRIASGGEKGGVAGFVIGNAVLVAPVVAIASAEIKLKAPTKKPKAPRPAQQTTAQRQDIPRPQGVQQVATGEGFEIPNVPVFQAFK